MSARTWLALICCGLMALAGCGSEESGEKSGEESEASAADKAGNGAGGGYAKADGAGWSCTLLSTSKSGDDSGVMVKAPGSTEMTPVLAGTALEPGSVVVTASDARAVLKMNDGGLVFLDNGSTVELVAGESRAARVTTGQAVFDLPKLEDAPHAHIYTPTGDVVLLGTKVAVSVGLDESRVTVTRGRVQAGNVEAGPGDEILLRETIKPSVAVSPDLGAAAGWAELNDEPISVPRGLGSLTAKQPGRSNDAPLKKVSQEVRVNVRGLMAYTEIEEVFSNETGQTLEGVYRFPLPDDAQISRLALEVNGRLQEGAFVENARAERIWKTVIRQWRDPAWLRWQHGNQFELRIFPIEPRTKRRVIIGYTQRLEPTSDGRAYVYPMPNDAEGAMPVDKFSFAADIRGHDSTRAMQVMGYQATVNQNEQEAKVDFAAENFKAAGDLILRYPLAGEAKVRAAGFRDSKVAGEDGFVVLSLRPELPRANQGGSRDVILVADRSYSRTGVSAELQSKLLSRVIAEMDPSDRVAVLACNERCEPIGKPGFDPPGVGTANMVHEALAALPPEGATNLLEPVRVAAAMANKRSGTDAQRPVRIIMLTDGMASTGALDASVIRTGVTQALTGIDARVSVVDLGGTRDMLAMEAIAAGGRGAVVELEPNATLTAHALAILGNQYGPVLTDATVQMPAGVWGVFPSNVSSLSAGEELVVVARASSGLQGDVVLRGLSSGKPFEQSFAFSANLTQSAGNAYVARLWAEQQIQALEMANAEANRNEIVTLSQRFGLISRHTSLLTLESDEMRREFGVRKDKSTRWDPNAPTEETVLDVITTQEPEQADKPKTTATASSDAPSPDGVLENEAFKDLAAGEGESMSGGLGMDALKGDGLGMGGLGTKGAGGGGGMADTGGSAGSGSGRSSANNTDPAEPRQEQSEKTQPQAEVAERGAERKVMETPPADDASAGPVEEDEESFDREASAMDEDADWGGDSDFKDKSDAKAPKKKEARRDRAKGAPNKKSMSKPRDGGDLDDLLGGGERNHGGKKWRRKRRVDVVTIKAADAPSGDKLVAKRRAAVVKEPDSITRRKALVRALSVAERFEEAESEAQAWIDMNPMDAEALVVSAEIQARLGRTNKAERLLANAVDAQPRAEWLRKRLAGAYLAIGDEALACAHQAALASVDKDIPAVSDPLSCPIATDLSFLDAVDGTVNNANRAEVGGGWKGDTSKAKVQEIKSADMTVTLTWNQQDADLDLGVIPPSGRYTTWLGGEKASFTNVEGAGPEVMKFKRMKNGVHKIDVVRRGATKGPVSGTLVIKAKGKTKTIEFVLDGERKTVAQVSKKEGWR